MEKQDNTKTTIPKNIHPTRVLQGKRTKKKKGHRYR